MVQTETSMVDSVLPESLLRTFSRPLKETVALPNVGADFRLCKLRYQAFYYRLLQHFLGLS
jgi:hypothetical protein